MNAPQTTASANLTALYTIARREVNRILRIWGQTLVPPAITMTLYFLIFGNLIGSRIGQMGGIQLHGFHRAGPGDDEHHPEQLRQHLLQFLRRQVRPPHRGTAGGSRCRTG
jgi:hypothetical protein